MSTSPADAAATTAAKDAEARETRALRASVGISILVGAIGIAWGLAIDSRIVLFDGVYSLFGTALSGLSLFAAWIASQGATERYPFGRAAVIPVAIVLQGAALLGTLVVALVDAVALLFSGGTEGTQFSVVVYAAVSGVLALFAIWWLGRLAPNSELVAAERDQWRAGAILSALIAVGAAVTLGLIRLGVDWLAPYGDPILVILAVIGLAPVPWALLRDGGREILEAAPPAPVRQLIEAAAAEVAAEHDLGTPTVRSTKLGRRVYVEVDYLVEPGTWDVSGEDEIRRAVIRRLEPSGYDVWATVELTTDPALIG